MKDTSSIISAKHLFQTGSLADEPTCQPLNISLCHDFGFDRFLFFSTSLHEKAKEGIATMIMKNPISR